MKVGWFASTMGQEKMRFNIKGSETCAQAIKTKLILQLYKLNKRTQIVLYSLLPRHTKNPPTS